MIEKFVKRLSEKIDLENVDNHYSVQFAHNDITKNNLIKYLNTMKDLKPKVMLVGESPGYNGCKLTGIPFTSEKILVTELKEGLFFGLKNGYKIINPDEKPEGKITATIVWNYFKEIGDYPLMWNSFPFHPYRASSIMTNRKVKANELDYGKEVLLELADIFSIEKIITVGGKAYDNLQKLGVDCFTVRHPANGGKNDFIAEMNNLL